MAFLVGADVGGTFTDFVAMDDSTGATRTIKVPSQLDDPAGAVLAGVRDLLADGLAPQDIRVFIHGATIALNTLLQRSGARVGLLTTAGFRDVLFLRRLRLEGAPGYYVGQPLPLASRRDIREVRGRLLADGTEVRTLNRDDVLRAARELVAAGCEVLAVSFLHAYRNPEHERLAARWIRDEFNDLYVALSSEVWPQQREYERTEVTVIDAHVSPVTRRYFERLVSSFHSLGITAPVFSTKSSGGIMSGAQAAERPVASLMSGPASGVVAAAALSRQVGQERLITFDMGGTSADIGLVESGEVRISSEGSIGDFPVIMPTVDVSSIGAGGGSIATVDAAGVLKVGPRSAGADPGPACYGRGGEEPTVTDAYVTLGLIGPDDFLGGTMALDVDAARRACAMMGEGVGLGPEDAAEAVLHVTTAGMCSRLLPLLAQRGVVPRECALLAYGGAGPTHAFLLAAECGLTRVLIPSSPGTFSALGSVLADLRADFVHTVYRPLHDLTDPELYEIFGGLQRRALGWIDEEGGDLARPVVRLTADMRYSGQSYEIDVALPALGDGFRNGVVEAFGKAHTEVYGYAEPDAAIDLVNARAHVLGVLDRPRPRLTPMARRLGREERRIRLNGADLEAVVVERGELGCGQGLRGPAVITQYDTTTFVPPGFRLDVLSDGTLEGTRID